jgi:homoserine trans-succinylase
MLMGCLSPRCCICFVFLGSTICLRLYRGADKSLARPTSRYILFDGENISFVASLAIYMNSTNIPPIMIINRIYEHQNLLSL